MFTRVHVQLSRPPSDPPGIQNRAQDGRDDEERGLDQDGGGQQQLPQPQLPLPLPIAKYSAFFFFLMKSNAFLKAH